MGSVHNRQTKRIALLVTLMAYSVLVHLLAWPEKQCAVVVKTLFKEAVSNVPFSSYNLELDWNVDVDRFSYRGPSKDAWKCAGSETVFLMTTVRIHAIALGLSARTIMQNLQLVFKSHPYKMKGIQETFKRHSPRALDLAGCWWPTLSDSCSWPEHKPLIFVELLISLGD